MPASFRPSTTMRAFSTSTNAPFLYVRISRSENLLAFGPLDIAGEAVLALFAVEGQRRELGLAALVDLCDDEAMPRAPQRLAGGRREIVRRGDDARVFDARARGDAREIGSAGGRRRQAAAAFVDFIVEHDVEHVLEPLVGHVGEAREVEQQIAVAVQNDNAAVRQSHRDAEPDGRAEAEVHLEQIRLAWPHCVPFARDRSDVRDDDRLRIENRGKRFKAVEALHLIVSPVSSTATGRCQLIVEPCASTIAFATSSVLLTTT